MTTTSNLKAGRASFALVGKVTKISDKAFEGVQVSSGSGYEYKRFNFGVETAEGNVIYVEGMDGYFPNKPIIKIQDKDSNEFNDINFKDRKIQSIVDSVSEYRVYKGGLTQNDKGKNILVKFISAYDFHDYLEANLKEGMEVAVRGDVEYSEYNGDTQRKYKAMSVYIPYVKDDEEIKYQAKFQQTILLTEDAFKKLVKKDAEAGEVVIPAIAVNYVGKVDGKQVKKNMPFNIAVTVKVTGEKTALILDKLFKVKKGKIRELTIEGDIINGYEQSNTSSGDIEMSAEVKELIELGLYTEEDVKASMTIRGNRVSKLIFARPTVTKSEDGKATILMNDDKYKPADLDVQMFDDGDDSELGTPPEDLDLSSDDDEDDDAWMKDLAE